jgi:hypothetical protein
MPTRTKANPPALPNPDDVLRMSVPPGEREGAALARLAIRPSVSAAQTIKQAARPGFDLGLQSVIDALREQTDALTKGDLSRFEAMLAIQAHTLDALGNYLARRAMTNATEGYLDASETYMRLALRAFSGCRANVETLATMKNPPALAIVRQANIGNAVQVNNGTAPPSRARAFAENSPNELLGVSDGERVDGGATATTGASHHELATVGAVHRTSE